MPLSSRAFSLPPRPSARDFVVRLLAHPGDAIDRLEHARQRWSSVREEDFPDRFRFAFRHLKVALERPYPKAMDHDELLAWAAHLTLRIAAFATEVEAYEAAIDDRPAIERPSGIRIRSTLRR
jgi:putative hemolysin